METTGVVMAVANANVGFLAIRGVSDTADLTKDDAWHERKIARTSLLVKVWLSWEEACGREALIRPLVDQLRFCNSGWTIAEKEIKQSTIAETPDSSLTLIKTKIADNDLVYDFTQVTPFSFRSIAQPPFRDRTPEGDKVLPSPQQRGCQASADPGAMNNQHPFIRQPN